MAGIPRGTRIFGSRRHPNSTLSRLDSDKRMDIALARRKDLSLAVVCSGCCGSCERGPNVSMGCVRSWSASCDFNKPYSVSKVEAGLRKKTGFVTVRNESRGSAVASPGVRKCFAAIFTTAQFKLSPRRPTLLVVNHFRRRCRAKLPTVQDKPRKIPSYIKKPGLEWGTLP